jgi:putative ABC transport system ATP-binding protein
VGSVFITVQATGVNHTFGTGETKTQVLFDNSLEIGRGEVVILTGPSGSGKTTLLTLIGTLRRVQEGSLIVLGREVAGMDQDRQVRLRRQVGFIFQHHNLFSSLTALENVRMAAGLLDSVSAAEATRRCTAILEELGLGGRMNHPPAGLSGGQRQRVAIARALVNEPALVLADEPTAALDATSGETVMALLRRMADGPVATTVLIVTHDQRLLDRADRVVNMVNGRIVSNVRQKEMVKMLRVLKQVKEVEGLNELTLTRLAESMSVECRPPGDTVIHEGTEGDRIYTLADGVVEAYADGRLVRTLAVGETFGTITSVSHHPVEETVRTRTAVELYVLEREAFAEVMAADRGFEERVRTLLMTRQSA